jgi:uncharacterized FlgJ-related protein
MFVFNLFNNITTMKNFIIIGLLGYIAYKPTEIKTITKDLIVKEVIDNNDTRFSPQLLKDYIKSLNIRHADIVYAQAVLETGNFTSDVFTESHNLFGMKQARQRPCTALDTSRGHAKYSSWRQSVLDYAMFSAKYLSTKSRGEYFDYLSENYAEDKSYVTKLKKICDQ